MIFATVLCFTGSIFLSTFKVVVFFPLLQFEEACSSSCLAFVEFGVTFLCLRIITFMADKLTIETNVNIQQIAVTIYMAITYIEMSVTKTLHANVLLLVY